MTSRAAACHHLYGTAATSSTAAAYTINIYIYIYILHNIIYNNIYIYFTL